MECDTAMEDVLETEVVVINAELPFSKYQHWFKAIINNDLTAVNHIMDSAENDSARHSLLNGRFIFDMVLRPSSRCLTNLGTVSVFDYPIYLAASGGSQDVLNFIIQSNGSNILIQDAHGNNLIHILILTACEMPHKESVMRSMYDSVMTSLPLDVLRKLLMMENNNQLRPIELAAVMVQYRFVRKLLETEGVYKISSGYLGSKICYRYDVTDYEEESAKRRRGKSPLDILTHIQHEHLMDPEMSELLRMPMMELWLRGKVQAARNGFLLWLLLRVTFHVMVTFIFIPYAKLIEAVGMVDTSDLAQNSSSYTDSEQPTINLFDLIYLGSLGVPMLYNLFNALKAGVYWLVSSCQRYRHRKCSQAIGVLSKRFGVVRSPLYPFLHIVLNLGLLAMPLCLVLNNIQMLALCFVVVSFCNLWSFLFFLQFLPIIGKFILVFFYILPYVLPFLAFMFLIFCVFALTFSALNTIFSSSSQDFGNFSSSLYSTFGIMLNMQDLSELIERFGVVTHILHVSCVFILAIILINFLIALMSDAVADIFPKRELVCFLHSFKAAQIVENWWISNFFLRRQCTRQQTAWLHHDKGRYYIVCYEPEAAVQR